MIQKYGVGCFDEEEFSPEEAERFVINMLEKLPSAEPEIIHCRDCEYGEQDHEGDWFCRSYGFQIGGPDGSGFCSEAEENQ